MAKDDYEEPKNSRPEPDPVVDSSLSGPILVSSVLLFFSLVWGLYDELIAQRPWKSAQRQFVKAYTTHLQRVRPRQAAVEKAVRSSGDYRRIETNLKSAEDAVARRVSEIDQELSDIRRQLAVIKDPFQDVRAKIASLTYELDHSSGEGRKNAIKKDIEEVKRESHRLEFSDGIGQTGKTESVDYYALENRFFGLKARESQLTAERAAITEGVRELQARRGEYLSDNLEGLNQQQIDGLLRKMKDFTVEIKQIHIEEAGLVDRCESCHLGILEPLTLTAADMGGKRQFVSHPNKALLGIHDPGRFGCTPCHNGNGLATSSARKAHGNYKHWLWPLFPGENSEAGCLQCHFHDRVLDQAPLLNRGRDLYQLKGCYGCHRHEEYDREADALTWIRKQIQNHETRQKEARLEAEREIRRGDAAQTNDVAEKHYAAAEILRGKSSNLDAEIKELEQKAKFLMQDQKKIGPNLKDVRLKLRKEWIPAWLTNPHEFRPGTKMPRFRLRQDEVRALSAFIWRSGFDRPQPASRPKGDAARGRELFETRGCLGCHSMGEGGNRQGGEFAANLSRIGEKAGYDYIVRWVHSPRERTRPYCPHEKRDLGPEDYSRHGLPYVFDLERSTCPNDGHQLQVQNMTVMPSLRLSWDEAQDIATYLTSLRRTNASYPTDVSFMDDPKMAEKGRILTSRYGCASCHEISGLEEAPRIGTELTKEGSKPLEQLDFGLLEHQAKKEGWYDHKGFFERKLKDPAVFDQGREKAPEDLLRMPNLGLPPEDVRALTTFLLGSLDSPFRGGFRVIPEQLRYIATDQQRDIQEGWWIVKKYNCMGCHTIQVGQKSVLSGLRRYQDPDWKEQLPPSLLQEGARVNPEWLTRFLENPALDRAGTSSNGVRTYLHARMPTFHFSPNEIRILVRFFAAMAAQDAPYIPTKLDPVEERERQLARELFSSSGAPCLKCHLVGDPRRDRFATAPSFLMAKERLKPAWTARWMLDPQAISPGTAMPSGLFRREGARWVFAGPTPAAFAGYKKDHVDLLVRYMLQLTPDEQQRLIQRMPVMAAGGPGRSDVAMRAETR